MKINASWRMMLPALVSMLGMLACSPPPQGLLLAEPAETTVKMDFFHRPLPEIALPNDIATRYDASSATGRRINASMIATTTFEVRTRALLDELDGWGVLQPIVIPFTGPLDLPGIIARHRDTDYDLSDDVLYLVNVDRESGEFGRVHHLDLGNGNYPVALEKRGLYWKNDPRGDLLSLAYEETNEDLNGNGRLDAGEDVNGNGQLDAGEDVNGNGVLDPPEDTDADGILDVANYLPGAAPAADDLPGRSDALMTFYERSTNTLIARPMLPLRERTTYAVVVTRRIADAAGKAVGSPYPYVNHTAQTEALRPLLEVMPAGLGTDEIAFAFTFTTQSIEAHWKAIRDGLYGHGVQAHLSSDYPAELDGIEPMRDESSFPNMTKPHLLYGELWGPAMEEIGKQFLGTGEGELLTTLVEGTGYVDYYVIGRYQSPQLFPRQDASGAPLEYNAQSWPEDLDLVPAATRSETVYFSLAVPRKEVSARGEGKPAPVALLGHGYTGNRFDTMQFASYVARHGIAVMSIDGPSHGLSLSAGEEVLAKALLTGMGLGAAGEALLKDRAFDQNEDGAKDSGADFWTAYLFHTRDIVRQFALDYMQLVRIFRGFDGSKRWSFDVDGDGTSELAGDFDADGQVDVGGDAPMYMFGGSLGGIMSSIVGSVEPEISAIAPISGGGGYSDIGIRSVQGGVYQAFILRGMGPLFVGSIDADSGQMLLETIVPDLNDDATFTIGTISGVASWDTMVVENLANGERGCGFVSPEGTVRASLPCNVGDPLRVLFYRGPQLDPNSEDCALRAEVDAYAVLDRFSESVGFQGQTFDANSSLVALAEGLGLRRGHPDLRKFQGLGQLVLDPADPAVLAPHLLNEPLYYPGTKQSTATHSLIITTMGDMNVPASSGLTLGRAAGLIGYLEDDARYGKPANQELIDNYTAEAIHLFKRYTNSNGDGVHLDIENFSGGNDLYGEEVPRIAAPMRLGFEKKDAHGGKSAAIFPYNIPQGQHGFDMPGQMTDKEREQCAEQCQETGDDPCGCSTVSSFDIGFFMMNMIGRYFSSGGQVLDGDLCQSRNDCPGFPAAPSVRTVEDLK